MQPAQNPIFALEKGALVEVKYSSANGEGAYRWIAGLVISCDDDSWPLVRLSDDQITEIRPYMTWRLVQGAANRMAA